MKNKNITGQALCQVPTRHNKCFTLISKKTNLTSLQFYLTSTTSVPPFCIRDVKYSVSSVVKEQEGLT